MTRRRALVSVSDKAGVAEFAKRLTGLGWQVLSTGGTARLLAEAGVAVVEVETATGHPEMMEGRVKTLHPAIHAGVLARRDVPADMAALKARGYAPIDLVAVNLYPFRETVADPRVPIEAAMDNLDVGGPAMLRAAAKNHRHVWIVTDPSDYETVAAALAGETVPAVPGAETPCALRCRLAAKAFALSSAYDRAAADFLAGRRARDHSDLAAAPPAPPAPPADGSRSGARDDSDLAAALRGAHVGAAENQSSARHWAVAEGRAYAARALEAAPAPDRSSPRAPNAAEPAPSGAAQTVAPRPLRYGENPGQTASFLPQGDGGPAGLAALQQLHGKALSYNNFLDLDGALRALAPFAFCPRPAVAVVKHTSPCGLAAAETLAQAFARARRTDPVSAFGSVVAANRPVDAATAAELASMFVECVVAPSYSPAALEALAHKKSLRLLAFPGAGEAAGQGPHPSEPAEAAWWREAGGAAQAAARFLARAAEHPEGEERRSVYGGALVQSAAPLPFYLGAGGGGSATRGLAGCGSASGSRAWRVVTRRKPSEAEADDLAFAWAVVAGVKSNAVVLARDGTTVGVGGGLASRVDAARLAVRKARETGEEDRLAGVCMASDAFLPFRDGLDEAAEAGVGAVVQPGGSVRDQEVVDAADEHGIAMVFTGQRLFRH